MRIALPHSHRGYTLVEMLVVLGLLGTMALGTAAMMRLMSQTSKRVEDRHLVEQMREYYRANVDCRQSLQTYLTSNGDTSACLPGRDRAALLRTDGTLVVPDFRHGSYGGRYWVRARCVGMKKILVEYVKKSDRKPEDETDWADLYHGSPPACDEAVLNTGHGGWGPGKNAGLPQTFSEQDELSDFEARASTRNTSAYCAKLGNIDLTYDTGYVNCPADYHMVAAEARCHNIQGWVHSAFNSTHGIFLVCCGSVGSVKIRCSRSRDGIPTVRVPPPKLPDFEGPIVYVRTDMVNTFRTCRGPNPGTTYNAFAHDTVCAEPYRVQSVTANCRDKAGTLTRFHASREKGVGGGECCASNGTLLVSCQRKL